ncbi:MAG: pilus assembly protein PilM [Dehalococcoidia bacterium]|nr:pilus assembly protein PilM [Dehalococcoidia bacterium]
MSEITTITIESTDLRFMVSDGSQIKRWGSVPLEPGIVKDGLILEPDAMCGALSELIASKQMGKGNVIAGLSGFKSVHRNIELPKMPKKLIGDAILAEAKRVMPISLEQIYVSWQNLSQKNDELQRFFLLGVPQNMMDAQIHCLHHAGIEPRMMNLKPLALARMVNRAEALIIDIEPEGCSIILIAGGIPAIMRSIVMNPDYSSSDRAQYILQEFDRTLQFYESSYVDHPLGPETPIFLTGLLSGEEELTQAIASGAGYHIEPLESPLACPADFPLAQYAVNTGLALNGGAGGARRASADGWFLITDLNIMPDVYLPKGFPVKKALVLAGVVAGIALVLPLYQMVSSAADKVSTAEAQSESLKQQLASRQAQTARTNQQVEQLEKDIERIQSETQAIPDMDSILLGLQNQRQRVYDALSLAIVLSPGDINLSSISYANNGLDLKGDVTTATESGEQTTGFQISLMLVDESIASGTADNADYGWQGGGGAYYGGYRSVIDYADRLRDKTDWFSDVYVSFINSTESSVDSGEDSEGGV